MQTLRGQQGCWTMDARQIEAWLKVFLEPGQVTELRALDYRKNPADDFSCTMAGFYDYGNLTAMAEQAVILSPNSTGVYFVPNPIKPSILARCANRVKKAQKDSQVSDRDIAARRWMLFDADPIREEGVSSTDEEKGKAFDMIVKVRDHIAKLAPTSQMVFADSGNGYHLLCSCDFSVEDNYIVQLLLNRVGDLFDNEFVKIDRKVFNPARIVKLYGTLSRKGDHTLERPHRLSQLLETYNVAHS